MKKTMFILAIITALLLVGCKKEQPKPKADTMPKVMEQTAAQTQQTAEKSAAEANAIAETTVAAATEQTICPIMNKPIDKNIFVEYKGKKVYFCCKGCIAEFNKDPEKWIKDLPQFKQ